MLFRSLQTKADVLEFFNVDENKIHVIHFPASPIFTPIHDEAFDAAVKKKFTLDFPFALFVGQIEPRKNIIALVKAFELLHSTYKTELHLVLVGRRGWLYREIFDSINRSPLRSKIHYLEYVPDVELSSLYRHAEFFIYPSLYEGYGSPVLEAMTSGVAVITSKSSSLQEIWGNAALLVDPNNVEEIAHALQTLHQNESKRIELSKLGLEHVKAFSSQAAADSVLRLYKSLMSQ